MIAAAAFGVPVASHLASGGMRDPGSESSRVADLLEGTFDQGNLQLILTVTSPDGVTSPEARAMGREIVRELEEDPRVGVVSSPWNVPTASGLVSTDGTTGLVIAGVSGSDNEAQQHAKVLAGELQRTNDQVTVRAGGEATIYWQTTQQTERDLLLMEALAMPLSFVALVWVFGGVLAASIPLAVGVMAIAGAMASLRVISQFTDVSIFALNLAIALGLALAIDYTLLILSRFRDELAEGRPRDEALLRTMMSAGRTVVFSAATVALSMLTMILFPQFFLKSFAYAGVAVVAFAMLAALLVTPAAVALLGDRLDMWDVRRALRRILGRDEPKPVPAEQTIWYRSTKFVMRRAMPIGAAVITLLLLLGAPFLGVRWGFPDDRMLPQTMSSREVGDLMREEFSVDPITNVTIALPDADRLSGADLGSYAANLSTVADVTSVSAPDGTYIGGRLVGAPSAPTGISSGSAFLTLSSSAPLFSDGSARQLQELREVAAPGGKQVMFGGIAAANQDSVHAVISRVPVVLGLIGGISLVLLFLLTGSVVLPVKAVLLNLLSLTAVFGSLVWVFQDGNLGALGSAVTGALEVNIPVLMFCIAFGLSMDYEVFLISRIREYWLASDRSHAANRESVALGVAHTGRVITAAALLMSISFAALMASEVSFMRMFGLGLTIAVLVDATLVRMLLVPAFMQVLGRANWWAPRPLVRLHERFGISENAYPLSTVGPPPRS
ncbi:MMPL family transporter [soil metagenome]